MPKILECKGRLKERERAKAKWLAVIEDDRKSFWKERKFINKKGPESVENALYMNEWISKRQSPLLLVVIVQN
jgi:hypothetical protein